MNAWKELANAVVTHAAKDWRDAVKRLKKNPDSRNARETQDECEAFFESDWCILLAGMDGGYILRRLR